MLTARAFSRRVLKLSDGRPEFIVDGAPWLREALIQLGLAYHHQAFRPRSLVESAFSAFKQRTRIFFNKITVNLRYNQHLRWRRAIEHWNLFCDMLTYHYNCKLPHSIENIMLKYFCGLRDLFLEAICHRCFCAFFSKILRKLEYLGVIKVSIKHRLKSCNVCMTGLIPVNQHSWNRS